MKELNLQEIKEVEFNILKVFDAFCKENNIKYYLAHGTLLGAIRYKKFIPWDDDIDVLIPREDYNRLVATFKDDDRYKLFAYEKNPDFRFPFGKLCDMTTKKVEPADNGVELGLDIDLFPLDVWDDDLEKAKKEARKIKKNMGHLALSKLEKSQDQSPLKRAIKTLLIRLCKMKGSGHYIEKIQKASYRKDVKEKKYIGCKAWCVYGEKGIIPARAFAETMEIEFEGEMFPAPAGYDEYLTCLFGDYLPEPPEEKRKTHHVFTAYKL
ncbi:MAG: LicD family protein [Clostridia bacterium]|nr:LicD family protein [Clostridia bacterium]